MNEDICLAICKLLKQPRTVKIDENKLLFDEEDNQTLFKGGATKPLKTTFIFLTPRNRQLYLHPNLCTLFELPEKHDLL